MLSALMLTGAPERPPLARMWKRLFPTPVSAVMDHAAGRPFVRISCELSPGRRPDWRMIEACCLDSAGRLLMPAGTEPPGDSGLRRFVPSRYCRRLLENLALYMLIRSELPPNRRRVALYGREAEVSVLLPRIAPLAGSLHIITRRAYALESAVNGIQRGTGISVTVSDAMNARGCCMLLAPSGGACATEVDDGTVVLAPDRPYSGKVTHIPAALPQLPAELEELGAYYDTVELCGAFYEIAEADYLGSASPRCGILNGVPAPPDELAGMLRDPERHIV